MRVKEYRLKKGYSQQDMADFLGIDQSAYSRRENGLRSFDAKEVVILERVLEATTKELFKEWYEEIKSKFNK